MKLNTIRYTLVVTNLIFQLLTARLKPSYDSDSVTESLKLFHSLIVLAKKLNMYFPMRRVE